MNRKLYVSVIVSALGAATLPAWAGGGEADYAEHNPPVVSVATRDQVRAEMMAALANGQVQRGEFAPAEQGVLMVASTNTRDQVHQQALAALRAGTLTRGESVEQDQGIMQLASASLAAQPLVADATPPAAPSGDAQPVAQPVASLANPSTDVVAQLPARREEDATAEPVQQ